MTRNELLKVNAQSKGRKETRRRFAEVSESRHSPLVLVGAPAQGYGSPLIRVRIKCSLRADSSTLRHGESPTTVHTHARGWWCPVQCHLGLNTKNATLRKNTVVAPPSLGRCTITPMAVYTAMFGATPSAGLRFKRHFESLSNFR